MAAGLGGGGAEGLPSGLGFWPGLAAWTVFLAWRAGPAVSPNKYYPQPRGRRPA